MRRTFVTLHPLRLARALLLGLVLLVGTASTAQGTRLPPEVFDSAARALVRLVAEGCPSSDNPNGGSRVSQGFVLGPGEVLTVRHAVAGCRQITVQLFGGEEHHLEVHRSPAQPVKFLSSADLVLLQLEVPEGVAWPEPLVVSGSPQPDTEIFAIARFKSDIASPQDKRLRVAQGGRRLRNIVDGKAREELELRKSPSLDLEIIKLDGVTITPGTSGAPIIDASGRVVGIADGGLDGGITQLTWAIPAEEVERLLASTETSADAQAGQEAHSLFAAEQEFVATTGEAPAIRCGDREFVLVGTVGTEELMMTSDDPLGGAQLLASSVTGSQATRFDVYQDLESGGAFAVPEGGQLVTMDSVCAVELGEHVGMVVWSKAVSDVNELQAASAAFETAVGAVLGQVGTWVPDPSLTYTAPLTRDDGLIAMRKSFVSMEPLMMDDGSVQPLLNGALFETLVARGDTLVASIVFYQGGEQGPRIEQSMQCLLSDAAACASLADQASSWEQALLAVHLTTFPRN